MFTDIEALNYEYMKVSINNKWGILDNQGNQIVTPKYDKIEATKGNHFKVKHNGKWGAVDFNGNVVVEIKYGPLQVNKYIKALY